MKKLLILSLFGLLSGCVLTGNRIDLSQPNSYGLKCSSNAYTAPNWEGCMASAQQLCAPQSVTNIQQIPPSGSGSADDSYFMTFSCQ